MSRKKDTTPGSRCIWSWFQSFKIENTTFESNEIPPIIATYFNRTILDPGVHRVLSKLKAYQIRAGSEQELREAAGKTWLYPLLFFLSNSSEEHCDPPSHDAPRYEQREWATVPQEEFVTGEALSSSPAADSQMSQNEFSSLMSQDSNNLSEGVSESDHLSRITLEPATTLTALLFLQEISECR